MAVGDLIPWRGKALDARRGDNPILALRNEMDRLFDDVFSNLGTPLAESMAGFEPRIDIEERTGDLRVTAELPGMTDRDVEISVTRSTLTIRGEKHAASEKSGRGRRRTEREYGFFERTIPLPVEVDPGGVDAVVKDGVATIILPKSEKAPSSSRTIRVQAG